MAEIQLKVYPISIMQVRKLREKHPTFAGADVSIRAEREGVTRTWYRYSSFYTRNAYKNSPYYVTIGTLDGKLHEATTTQSDNGLRLSLHIVYNAESDIVKNHKQLSKKAIVWNKRTGKGEPVTSTAPVVVYGKKEYIWLNMEECEIDKAKTMELVSVKLLAKSAPFNRDTNSSDFANAVELQKQCFDVATENCTEEELSMLVPVVMSDKDNYNTATPIFETEKKTNTTPSSNKVADKDKGGK